MMRRPTKRSGHINLRRTSILRYVSWAAALQISRWSACPSIAAISIKPEDSAWAKRRYQFDRFVGAQQKLTGAGRS